MTPEFLEYELRRLPDVVSVAVDESAVTLLVSPSADADAIRVSVAAMLAAAAVELDVKVLGGVSPATVTRMRVAPIAVGSAAGIGLLATAAAVAALTGAVHLGNPQVHQPTAAARPPATAAPLPNAPRGSFPNVVVPGAPPVGGLLGTAPSGPDTTPSVEAPPASTPAPPAAARHRPSPAVAVTVPVAPQVAVPPPVPAEVDIPVLPGPQTSPAPAPPPNDYVGTPAPEIPAPVGPVPLAGPLTAAPLAAAPTPSPVQSTRPPVATTPAPAPPTGVVAVAAVSAAFHPCPPGLAIGLRAHRLLPQVCDPAPAEPSAGARARADRADRHERPDRAKQHGHG